MKSENKERPIPKNTNQFSNSVSCCSSAAAFADLKGKSTLTAELASAWACLRGKRKEFGDWCWQVASYHLHQVSGLGFGIYLVKCNIWGIVASLWDFGQQPWIWQFGIWEVFIRRSCCIIPGLCWCYCCEHWHGLAFGECNRNPQPFSESVFANFCDKKNSFFTTGWFLAEIVLVML